MNPEVLTHADRWHWIAPQTNSHIRIAWGWYEIELRVADLIVLHEALSAWSETAGECAECHELQLNDHRFHFASGELVEFGTCVRKAYARLPRKVVRWADLTVTINVIKPQN